MSIFSRCSTKLRGIYKHTHHNKGRGPGVFVSVVTPCKTILGTLFSTLRIFPVASRKRGLRISAAWIAICHTTTQYCPWVPPVC